jgi:hypothetical protein
MSILNVKQIIELADPVHWYEYNHLNILQPKVELVVSIYACDVLIIDTNLKEIWSIVICYSFPQWINLLIN